MEINRACELGIPVFVWSANKTKIREFLDDRET